MSDGTRVLHMTRYLYKRLFRFGHLVEVLSTRSAGEGHLRRLISQFREVQPTGRATPGVTWRRPPVDGVWYTQLCFHAQQWDEHSRR
ncbi:MAG: hypothetical protein N2508_08700 [Anaerolineae bacterium]|nr:hypothetical protein [Anaerolineae bacterium]